MDNHALLAFVGPEACRFALMEAAEPRPRLSQYRVIPVRRDQSLLTVMAEYAAGLGRPLPPRLGLAVAAPVNDERITVTQSGWSFTRAELCETFGFEALSIINDAAAYSAMTVSSDWSRRTGISRYCDRRGRGAAASMSANRQASGPTNARSA